MPLPALPALASGLMKGLSAAGGFAGTLGSTLGSVAPLLGGDDKRESFSYNKVEKEEIPEWLRSRSKDALALAGSYAGRDYRGFEGDRVAGLTDNLRSAIGRAGSTPQMARDLAYRGSRAVGAQPLYATGFEGNYLNPYQDDVIGNTVRDINRASATHKRDLRSSAAARNAFGSYRRGFQDEAAERSRLEAVGDVSARLRHQGWQSALEAARGDESRRLNTEARNRDAARAGASMFSGFNNEEINSLLRTGGVERTILNEIARGEYADYLDEREHDRRGLDALLSALRSVPYDKTRTTEGSGETVKPGKSGLLGGLL